ncbi:hypothetical protein JHK85_009876 [Glycine max]|nr:hypothetical protein JHK85_009876 [Glycine max]
MEPTISKAVWQAYLYKGISQAPWFTWNPTTVAELVALLHNFSHHSQFESLISNTSSRLQPCQCDLVFFYNKLIDPHSKRNSHTAFDAAFGYLHNLVRTSSSLHVKRMAYQYMVSYLCLMDRPCEAEDLVLGLQPSSFIVRAWGIREGATWMKKAHLHAFNSHLTSTLEELESPVVLELMEYNQP